MIYIMASVGVSARRARLQARRADAPTPPVDSQFFPRLHYTLPRKRSCRVTRKKLLEHPERGIHNRPVIRQPTSALGESLMLRPIRLSLLLITCSVLVVPGCGRQEGGAGQNQGPGGPAGAQNGAGFNLDE